MWKVDNTFSRSYTENHKYTIIEQSFDLVFGPDNYSASKPSIYKNKIFIFYFLYVYVSAIPLGISYTFLF